MWNTQSKMKIEKSLCNLECPNCHRITGHHLARKVATVQLYYILPIFRYTEDRYISCDVCNCGTTITKKEFNILRGIPFQEDLIPVTRKFMMAHGYKEQGYGSEENGEIPGIASNVNGASFYDLYNTSYKTASTLEPGSVPQKSGLKLLLLILTAVCGCLSILWTLLIASFMEVGDPVLALLILIIPGYLITGLFFLLYKHKPNKC